MQADLCIGGWIEVVKWLGVGSGGGLWGGWSHVGAGGNCSGGNCSGNWANYSSEGGFILNCSTGGRTNFERNGGIYKLYLWIKEEDLHGGNHSKCGARQEH